MQSVQVGPHGDYQSHEEAAIPAEEGSVMLNLSSAGEFEEITLDSIASSATVPQRSPDDENIGAAPSAETLSDLPLLLSPRMEKVEYRVRGILKLKLIVRAAISTLKQVILLGNSGVGKSSLCLRFVHGEFPESKTYTGIQIHSASLNIDGKTIPAQIWASNALSPMIIRGYCRGATRALLVYDITKYESFVRTIWWLEDVRDNGADPNVVITLVGNKSDLEHLRKVPIEEAQAFASSNSLLFMETSALDASNVEAAFQTTARQEPSLTGFAM